MSEVPGIYSKIAKIQAEVGAIPMNGVGPASKGSYAFIKGSDIALGIRNQLIKHNVIVQVKTLEHNVNAREVGTRTVINTNILVSYRYIDADDGSEFENIVGGEGSDIGSDTATRKAYTQALKINQLQVFSIVTGEEPDGDAAEPMPEHTPAEPKQSVPAQSKKLDNVQAIRSEIKTKFIDTGLYTAASLNALGDKITGKTANGSDGWGMNVADQKKILKALEAGEVA